MTSTPSTARSSQQSWLRRFAVRRPLTAFLVLGMSLGYTLAFVWGLAYNGVIPGGGLADALNIAARRACRRSDPDRSLPGRPVRDLG